ncbi:acyl-CoA reductase-like NAD-dependent aldehyde dehydrogenase [Saccharococcus thermophilus]|uniref:Acyl-CoA reductase-like NAD-dependent aldehyde dehydrogenase n=1 Tax=Saccharococcus thermophilus TaxID=29396 RepID=A0A846ML34_9BACL|nr:acyl-CoA reductase-like NAD-dependent aldehyde dehydrogenase [Saccharococcus thermophilus]
MIRDIDLQSIQEVRNYLEEAKSAQKIVEKMTQSEVDQIVESMANAAREKAKRLAVMAVEETGFGNVPDKVAKNLFAANDVYNAIKDMKSKI